MYTVCFRSQRTLCNPELQTEFGACGCVAQMLLTILSFALSVGVHRGQPLLTLNNQPAKNHGFAVANKIYVQDSQLA
jgi:hypothetical protein